MNTNTVTDDIFFRLTVDYGQYDIQGEGVVELEARYFCFNRGISSEDAIKETEAAGWEAAKIEHLLSHRKTFPGERLKFPIIGLGPVDKVRGNRLVPCLSMDVFKPDSLSMSRFDGDWLPTSRFLAVRKVSGA